MTGGQERALLELRRLYAARPDDIETVTEPAVKNGRLVVVVSIRMGAMETREEGLKLFEREEFILSIPADFPFQQPALRVVHDRFAKFPHVIWSHGICLYRQAADWNPRGGLYGFFEKLRLWLAKAAINDMDPLDVPLEPPHHDTDFSQVPFVIRANAPVAAGEQWIGFANLRKHANRIELVGWTNLDGNWPAGTTPALAVVLPKALPMEFPEIGEDFFRELARQNVDRGTVLRYLAFAAHLTNPGDEIHLVLGVPMRRSVNGEPRLHIAVWTTSHKFAEDLRLTLRENNDSPSLVQIRSKLAELIYGMIANDAIKFCHVLDDRPEIVVARDHGSAASWFSKKRILLLGCGALGSWIGEIAARAGAAEIHLVDSGFVKPGILARQNFTPDDIGSNKAQALARRLGSLSTSMRVEEIAADAHAYLTTDFDRFRQFDLVIDCTASSIFQMKLERDWARFAGATPPMISIGIDAEAKRCIAVKVPRGATGGIWDAFLQLQYRLCVANTNSSVVDAFYTERGHERLFQPEPGCSEPTFVGSTADVMTLAATAINILVGQLSSKLPSGVAFSAPASDSQQVIVDVIELAQLKEVAVGRYRIRSTETVFREARAWVQQNNRIRSAHHETGGYLWGLWDDAIEIIWVFDASGPPPDSIHAPERFTCGVEGAAEEHAGRQRQTVGLVGFVGMWHTHPEMESDQSHVDIAGMTALVAQVGQNQRRALMIIFGHASAGSTATYYVYESLDIDDKTAERVSVSSGKQELQAAVV